MKKIKKKIISFTLDERIIYDLKDKAQKSGISASSYLTLILKGEKTL